mmetsp:Transcript_86999/g.127234  ORF Transcript_86999/g.127234 Transcript_86999/m.127234 type:complete len:103 (-) Transcript_86999:69-377(-)
MSFSLAGMVRGIESSLKDLNTFSLLYTKTHPQWPRQNIQLPAPFVQIRVEMLGHLFACTHGISLRALRVECFMKTDGGYPKEARVTGRAVAEELQPRHHRAP